MRPEPLAERLVPSPHCDMVGPVKQVLDCCISLFKKQEDERAPVVARRKRGTPAQVQSTLYVSDWSNHFV